MKALRLIGYFSQLRSLIGFTAASRFALAHLRNKIAPPKNGRFARVPVGPYVFYFTSIDYFVGLFTEIFFRETYYLAPTQAPIRVIDCGANIGMSLLYVKLRAPHAQVKCFEPNPAARKVLEKNIAENGWGGGVEVLPYALGKETGSTTFYVDDTDATSSGGSTAPHQKNKSHGLNSYSVEIRTLSYFIAHSIDLLKIDIEGGEFEVLEELHAADKLKLVNAVQLEYHYIPGFFTRPLSEMLVLLERAGFHTFVESNSAPHNIINRDMWHTYMIFAWR